MNPLGDLISQGYTFAQGLVGICVFFMIVYAGLCYMVNQGKDASGKPAWWILQDAAVGLVLLFSAYAILNTINTDLVTQKGGAGLPQRTTSQ